MQNISKMWYSLFRDDHPELDKSILKAKEAACVEYEEAGVEETSSGSNDLLKLLPTTESVPLSVGMLTKQALE